MRKRASQSSILHSLNRNQIAFLLFLDYNKSFDVLELDHATLLRKLDHYVIRGITLKQFESYLGGRSHFVSLNIKIYVYTIQCSTREHITDMNM